MVIQQRKTARHKVNSECLECGYTANADINGARNILAAGHAVLACEGRVQSDPPVEAGTRRGDSDISLNAVRDPRPLGRGGCQSK